MTTTFCRVKVRGLDVERLCAELLSWERNVNQSAALFLLQHRGGTVTTSHVALMLADSDEQLDFRFARFSSPNFAFDTFAQC